MCYKNIFSKFDTYKMEVQNTLEEINKLQKNNITSKPSCSESINNLAKQTLQLKAKIKLAEQQYKNNLAETNLQDIEDIINSNKLAAKQIITMLNGNASKIKENTNNTSKE